MGPQGLCLVVTPTPESLILTLSVPRAGNRKPEAEHKSFSVEISERQGSLGRDCGRITSLALKVGMTTVPASEDCRWGLSKSRAQQILQESRRK